MTLSLRAFFWLSLACASFAVLALLPGLPGDFVLDDLGNIVDNTYLRLQTLAPGAVFNAAVSPQPGSETRVLPMLSFALDYYRAGGMEAAAFKSTNIAIHAFTTLVLAWFLRDLLRIAGNAPRRAHWLALGMALAWALHPLHVSSVLYVVQRMQTLATLFVLLAMWAYLRARWAQIEGRPARTGWMLTGLLWAIAMACKEDAILLPAYLLAAELTVLRFQAADAGLARTIRRAYGLAVAIGIIIYGAVIVPHYWQWDSGVLRNFSTGERLLTQGRVLCLYLWQILAPLPSNMPFYYDWLQPSRSLAQPWTTLPALLLLAALVGLAWHLRHRRPLFSLGVFLFFGGHFVTSNVINLELAFEHRNHFPLIGVILAVGDGLAATTQRIRISTAIPGVGCGLILIALATGTLVRANDWRSGLALAQTSVSLAPDSVRAWNSLCVEWYELGGGPTAANPRLGEAITACTKAAELATDSVASLTNVIAFKTLQGTVSDADWDHYLVRLRQVPLKNENVYSMWVLINLARMGIGLDEKRVLAAIAIINDRVNFKPFDYAAIGYFILEHTAQPDQAYPYFESAVQASAGPKFAEELADALRKEGRAEWADRLNALPRKQP